MSAIAVALFILIRVFLPVGVLIAIGEWVRRRESQYWFRSLGSYGKRNHFSLYITLAAPAARPADCRNPSDRVSPAQVGCALAGRGAAPGDPCQKGRVLEGQGLPARADAELHRPLLAPALLADEPPAQWLFTGGLPLLSGLSRSSHTHYENRTKEFVNNDSPH